MADEKNKPPVKEPNPSLTQPKTNNSNDTKSQPKQSRNPRIFIVDEGLLVSTINLIGAGTYNANPPVPSRDVMQVVAALRNLRPYNLNIEQKEPTKPLTDDKKPEENKTGAPTPPPTPRTFRVFLMDENLRNITVNLLGAGTFSQVPAAQVIRIVATLNALRPFDVNVDQGKPVEDKKKVEGK